MEKARSILHAEGIVPLVLRAVMWGLRRSHDALEGVLVRRLQQRPHASPPPVDCASDLPSPITPSSVERATVVLPPASQPAVSLIVCAGGSSDACYRTIASLARSLPAGLAYELLVAAVTPRKLDLRNVEGMRDILAGESLAEACNAAAHAAASDLLGFVSAGLESSEDWITPLLAVFHANSACGIVTPRVLLPDGRLLHAGWVMWKDASACAYGYLDSAAEPEYNYRREIDFATRHAMLVRRQLFLQAGGFRQEWAAEWRQDADLCFRARRLGYTVVFQPKATAIYPQPPTSPPAQPYDRPAEEEEADRLRFLQDWADVLRDALPPAAGNLPTASRRHQGRTTVLVVDTYVPLHDREAGSLRLFHILRLFRALGCRVIFAAQNEEVVEPYTSELQNLGVEVLYPTSKQPGLERQIRERAIFLDVAWICRPQPFGQFLPLHNNNPNIRFIYDTIDLHFVRLRREADLARRLGQTPSDTWKTYRYLELAYARIADATITASAADERILRRYGVTRTWVVPTIHPRYPGPRKPFPQRHGLLFIGSYRHPPNIDAVLWLCGDIMPLVWETLPELKVTLLGFDPPPEVQALASTRVAVPGFVADVTPFFLDSRVFVAPIRYGAGMNGKIGQSISFGLPTVTTSIGAEGVGLTHNQNALVADDAPSFAAAIVQLYTDAALWERISLASLDHVTRFEPDAVSRQLASLLDALRRQA